MTESMDEFDASVKVFLEELKINTSINVHTFLTHVFNCAFNRYIAEGEYGRHSPEEAIAKLGIKPKRGDLAIEPMNTTRGIQELVQFRNDIFNKSSPTRILTTQPP